MNRKFFNKHLVYSLIIGIYFFCFVPVFSFSAPITVNTTTANNQRDVDIAIRGDGDVVVVWTNEHDAQPPSTGSGTPQADIMGRRYNAGAPYTAIDGAEVVIHANGSTTVDSTTASVSMSSSGLAYVLYSLSDPNSASTGGADPVGDSGTDIRRNPFNFDAGFFTNGLVDSSDLGQIAPHSAVNDSGVDAGTWSSFIGAGNYDVKQEKQPGGGNIQTTASANNEIYSVIAIDNDGNTVTVWQEGDGNLYAEMRDGTQAVTKTRFRVNSTVGNANSNAAVAMDDEGFFSVVWQSSDGEVYMRNFSDNGNPFDNDTQVNTTTTNNQVTPDIAKDSSGNFVVTWVSEDGTNDTIYSATFDRLGTSITGETSRATTLHDTRTNTLKNFAEAKVDINDSGTFAVAWTSYDATNLNDVKFDVFTEGGFSAGATTDAIWTGGVDNWNDIANWNTGVVPNSTDVHVKVDNGSGTASTVTLDFSPTMRDLTLDSDDTINIATNTSLILDGGTSSIVSNSGNINLNSIGHFTTLRINNNTLFVDGGTVTVSNNSNNYIYSNTSNNNRLINVDNTFQGGGRFGNNSLALTNNHLINANNGIMYMDLTNNPTGGNINNGTLQASNNATLQMTGFTITNTNGLIHALAGAKVELNGVQINEGTVGSAGAGTVQVTGASTLNGNGNGITLNGSFVQNTGAGVNLFGTVTHTGNWAMNSVGHDTFLRTNGDVTIDGVGTHNMSNNVWNRFIGSASTDRLTLESDRVIQGSGQIGLNGMKLTNKGLINATLSNGIYIDPSSGTDGVVNNGGIIQADNNSFVQLLGGNFNNTNGVIQALTGGEVQLNGARIEHGTLGKAAAGTVKVISSATLDGSTTGIQVKGQVTQNTGTTVNLIGTVTHDGLWNMNSAGHDTYVRVNGDVTIDGIGTHALSNNVWNRFIGSASSDRLTLEENRVVQGSGQIGVNTMLLTNRGLIKATQSNTLTIDPSSGTQGVINSGTIGAEGGTLIFNGGSMENFEGANNGLVQANGNRVEINSFSISGGNMTTVGPGVVEMNSGTFKSGTFTNSSTGELRADSGSSLLSGVVNNPNGGQITVNTGAFLKLDANGTYTNAGLIYLNDAGHNTYLDFIGDVSLSGGGVVTLDSDSDLTYLHSTNNSRFTNVDQTIQGRGRVGNNTLSITNQATINANVNNQYIYYDAWNNEESVNTGLMQASNGGKLQISGSTINNAGGLIQAETGSYVDITGSRIKNGTLGKAGAGTIRFTGASHVDGSTTGINLVGEVSQNTGVGLELYGTITHAGNWSMNSIGHDTFNRIQGDVTIDGIGTHTLSNNVWNRFIGSASTNVLTLGASRVLQGAGQIGANSLKLVNQGLIDANQSNLLTIDPAGGVDGVVNTGILQASANRTLRLQGGIFNNTGGVIQALTGSTVQLSGVEIEHGTLGKEGAGTISVISASTLDGSGSGIQVKGQLTQNNNTSLNLIGTITHDGNWSMNSLGNDTFVRTLGNVTIDGTGTHTLSNNTLNRFIGNASTDVLTLEGGRVIEGAGQIGANSLKLVNKGLINANQSNLLTIDPANGANGVVNNGGILQASSNRTLRLQGGIFNNTGGVIQALTGSTVELSAVEIEHGILGKESEGTVRVISNATLDGSTTGIQVKGQFTQNNNTNVNLIGTITHNGDWSMNSLGNDTYIRTNGNVTIDGTGTHTLSNNTLNRFIGSLTTDVLTFGANRTVVGAGQLGANGLKIVNNGLISATVSNALTIDPTNSADGFVNNGIVEENGGNLVLVAGGTYTNNGVFKATGGSTLSLTSFGIQGTGGYTADNGTLNFGAYTYGDTGATGDLIGQNGGNIVLTGSTVNVNDVTLDATSSLVVNSSVVASGDVLYQTTNPADFDLDGPSSTLVMTGVAPGGASDFANYHRLEIGGLDLGNTPFNEVTQQNPDVNPSGMVNNMALATWVVNPGAHVQLVDLYNNMTGAATGLGDEALYVDTLKVDPTSKILLNNNSLYFNSITDLSGGALTSGQLNDIFITSVLNTRSGEHDNNVNWDDEDLTRNPKLLWTQITADGNTDLTPLNELSAEYQDVIQEQITIVPTVDGDLALWDVASTATFTGDILIRVLLSDLDLNNIPNNLSQNDLYGVHVFGGNAVRVPGTINGGYLEFYVPHFSGVGVGVNPEPSTILMLLLSFAGLGLRRFKR